MHLIGSAKYWSQDSVFAGFPTAGDAHLSFNFLDVDSIQFLTWADPGFFYRIRSWDVHGWEEL